MPSFPGVSRLLSHVRRSPSVAADDVLAACLLAGDAAEVSAAAEVLLGRGTSRAQSALVTAFGRLPAEAADRVASAAWGAASFVTTLDRVARSGTDDAKVSAAGLAAAAWSARVTDQASDGPLRLLAGLLRDGQPVFEAAADALCGVAESSGSRLPVDVEQAILRALDTPRGAQSGSLARAAVACCAASAATPGPGPIVDAVRRHQAKPWPLVRQRLLASRDVRTWTALLAVALRGGVRYELLDTLADGLAALHRPEGEGLLEAAHLTADARLADVVREVGGPRRVDVWRSAATVAEAGDPARASDALRLASLTGPVPDGTAGPDEAGHEAGGDGGDGRIALAWLRAVSAADADVRHPETVAAGAAYLTHANPRVARAAARVVARSPSVDAERHLLRACAGADSAVRPVLARHLVSRSLATRWRQVGNAPGAQAAARALVRLVPETLNDVARRIRAGATGQRLLAMQFASAADAVDQVRPAILAACRDPDERVRSKAVGLLSHLAPPAPRLASCEASHDEDRVDDLLDAVLYDPDARVRANAIEVVCGRTDADAGLDAATQRLLETRARLGRNRERANAIVGLAGSKASDVDGPLFDMLRDGREAHRLSAVWAVERTGSWRLLGEVAKLARADETGRVRRAALGTVRRVASQMRSAA